MARGWVTISWVGLAIAASGAQAQTQSQTAVAAFSPSGFFIRQDT